MNNKVLEESSSRDYFLETIIDDVCKAYHISEATLSSADNKAKELMSFKYLDKLNYDDEKNIDIKK